MFFISAGGNQIYKPLDDLLVLFNPKLTLEIGKAGSLEFDIPPVNPFYDRLNQLTTEITVDMDTEEIFHGRVLSVERTFNNIRHVYCEGDLSYLIDSVQKGVQYRGTTHELFSRIIANHNARVDASKRFTVGTVNIENRNIVLVGHSDGENINVGNIDYKQIALDSIVDEWNNSFDYIQTCLIDYCGGYLRTRRVNGTIYIDLLNDFGSNSSQAIELGRNLLDLTEEISVEDVFTVLIPLGDDNLTIASVNGGSDELVDADAVKRFGRIVRTHVFNNVTNASTLLENARRFMSTNANVPRTITIRAVDLHLVDKSISAIKLGDKVAIASYVHDVDDTLTCTKIEYDLERPENNNYTFGNPKQTLTQRYREDARLSNDTYGNSPSASSASPTAASAKGAAAAAQAAEKEKDKALKDFYDTWINEDKEHGTVSLGALYKRYIEDREVLINQCGIDLDASTGNININSLHKVVDDHGHQIAKNEADISVIQTDEAEKYQAVLDRYEDLAGKEARHHTEVTQSVSTLGSQIGILASDINDFDDRLTKSIASINVTANDLESRITQQVTYFDTVEGRLNGRMASIEMWANEKESAIALKADKVYVDGQLEAVSARIQNLMSGNTTSQHLVANTISAAQINLRVGSGTVPLVSTVHSHNITAREGDNGEITISLGTAVTDDIPQKTSFKIADTKYYKDHVAAVNIRSLEPDSYSSTGDFEAVLEDSYVRYSNEQIAGRIRITLGNNDIKTAVIRVSGTRAYNAGKDAGAETAIIKSVSFGSAGQPYKNTEEGDVWYANVRATGVARGTKSDNSYYENSSYSRNVAVDVTEVYNAGKAAGGESGSSDVSVTSLGFDPDDEVSYSSSVNNYYVPIKAVLSNNKYRTITLTVSGEAARNSVTVSGMQHYTQSGEQTITYDDSNQSLNAMVQATLTNGQTNVRTVSIPATLAYDAGAASVKADSIKLYTAWSESSTGYIYETANKRYKIRILASLSNNKSYSSTVYVPASEAFDAGAASGGDNVTISSIALNTEWATSSTGYVYQTANKRYAVNVKATASNENYSTNTIYVPASDAYNAGYDAGVESGGDSVTISSIALNTGWATSSTGYVYQTANKRYAVNVKATASNENYSTNTIYVPASDAYNAGYSVGYDAGEASVSISGSSVNDITYQSSYKRYSVKINAPLSNGSTPVLGPFYINASDAYNAGYYAGQSSVQGYTEVTYQITDSQSSSKIVINVVVYGWNGSQWVQVASGRHEYAK